MHTVIIDSSHKIKQKEVQNETDMETYTETIMDPDKKGERIWRTREVAKMRIEGNNEMELKVAPITLYRMST